MNRGTTVPLSTNEENFPRRLGLLMQTNLQNQMCVHTQKYQPAHSLNPTPKPLTFPLSLIKITFPQNFGATHVPTPP